MENMQESFEDILFYYENVGIERFILQAEEKGYNLTEEYTAEDIQQFERYVLNESVSHISRDKDKMIEFISCYFYLGFYFQVHYGGEWAESDRDKNSVYYGQPVIVDFKNSNGLEFSPRMKLIALILGRLKKGLKHALDMEAKIITYKSVLKDIEPEEDA